MMYSVVAIRARNLTTRNSIFIDDQFQKVTDCKIYWVGQYVEVYYGYSGSRKSFSPYAIVMVLK